MKLAAGLADLSLKAVSVDALIGNVSINTMLGFLQLGGISAISPAVLGDGLAIHLTLLAQILKAVNPLTVAAYGPALDAWAAMTPAHGPLLLRVRQAVPGRVSDMTDAEQRWQPIDASSFVERLEQVKALLEQASVVAAAQESARVAPLVELQRRLAEEQRGHQHR